MLRIARSIMVGMVAVCCLGTVRLEWAFLRSDTSFRAVAEQSRSTSAWPYRLAGLWADAEGSLWFFATIVVLVALLVLWHTSVAALLAAAATGAGLLAVCLLTAEPFGKLDVPATDGLGLTPILEHPAMAVHPPLLYVGFALLLAPAVLPAAHWAGARRALLAAVSLLTAAMALGGLWSYVEQGWGGYWAWDPVENTSLVPWLAALLALHAGERASPWLRRLPWLLVLWGSVLTRSGTATSVHAFASSSRVAWAMTLFAASWCAAVLAATFAWPRAVQHNPADDVGEVAAAPRFRPAVAVWGLAIAAAVVGLGTAVPAVAEAIGRGVGVRGEFFARLCAPVALLLIGGLARQAIKRAGRRAAHRAAWAAHLGFVLLCVGIAGSAFDRSIVVPLREGEQQRVIGLLVVNEGLVIGDGPRPGTRSVSARLSVDDRRMVPRLDTYPARGGRLAETSTTSRPWRDVQATLLDANDDGTVVVELRTRPLVQLIWLGAAVLTVGAGWSAIGRRVSRPQLSRTADGVWPPAAH